MNTSRKSKASTRCALVLLGNCSGTLMISIGERQLSFALHHASPTYVRPSSRKAVRIKCRLSQSRANRTAPRLSRKAQPRSKGPSRTSLLLAAGSRRLDQRWSLATAAEPSPALNSRSSGMRRNVTRSVRSLGSYSWLTLRREERGFGGYLDPLMRKRANYKINHNKIRQSSNRADSARRRRIEIHDRFPGRAG
jgi:hypothetical protein